MKKIAKLLILVQCCILGAITYFLIYGFFNLASKLFNVKFVTLFSNLGLVMFLLSYLFSVALFFLGVGDVSTVLSIAALLGIIKWKHKVDVS